MGRSATAGCNGQRLFVYITAALANEPNVGADIAACDNGNPRVLMHKSRARKEYPAMSAICSTSTDPRLRESFA